MDVIKNCPCCDCKGVLENAGLFPYKTYWVRCSVCGLSTSACLTIESAISKWNKRKGA